MIPLSAGRKKGTSGLLKHEREERCDVFLVYYPLKKKGEKMPGARKIAAQRSRKKETHERSCHEVGKGKSSTGFVRIKCSPLQRRESHQNEFRRKEVTAGVWGKKKGVDGAP